MMVSDLWYVTVSRAEPCAQPMHSRPIGVPFAVFALIELLFIP